MISEWIRAALDLILIGMVGTGLVQVMRLIKQLSGLHQGRKDMEHFVREFNSTVMRAESGIKGLRAAARDSGDDLEKLVEKAELVRDELQFIVESADQIAERLSQSAGKAAGQTARQDSKPAEIKAKEPAPAAAKTEGKQDNNTAPATAQPSSKAEQELLQALQKLS